MSAHQDEWDRVAAVPYDSLHLYFGHHVLSGMAVTSRSTKTITYVTRNYGETAFWKTYQVFVITSIINYQGILQLFPRG